MQGEWEPRCLRSCNTGKGARASEIEVRFKGNCCGHKSREGRCVGDTTGTRCNMVCFPQAPPSTEVSLQRGCGQVGSVFPNLSSASPRWHLRSPTAATLFRLEGGLRLSLQVKRWPFCLNIQHPNNSLQGGEGFLYWGFQGRGSWLVYCRPHWHANFPCVLAKRINRNGEFTWDPQAVQWWFQNSVSVMVTAQFRCSFRSVK